MPVSPDSSGITYPRLPEPPDQSPRDAPALAVTVGIPVAPHVRGLPAQSRLVLLVREQGRWKVLGRFDSDAQGRAVLPAFIVNDSGRYLLRIRVNADRRLYVRLTTLVL